MLKTRDDTTQQIITCVTSLYPVLLCILILLYATIPFGTSTSTSANILTLVYNTVHVHGMPTNGDSVFLAGFLEQYNSKTIGKTHSIDIDNGSYSYQNNVYPLQLYVITNCRECYVHTVNNVQVLS